MSKFTGEYTEDWPQIAQQTKEQAHYRCVRCGHPHDPAAGRCLTVHHIDGDKRNNAWWNLAALCQVCHLHIQAKVNINQIYYLPHSEWFKPYVAGFYAHLLGLPEDREYVMANYDELISEFMKMSM